jgi:hypothetical protein
MIDEMSTFKGDPETNAWAEQVQFENIKNRTKDSYKYMDKDTKDKKVDGLVRRRKTGDTNTMPRVLQYYLFMITHLSRK